MAAAAVLSVTLVPVLVGYWIRGRILPEYKNPINRWLTAFYRPLLAFVFRFKWLVLALVVLLMAISLLTFLQTGLGIHASPLGRRPSLHAHHFARNLHHQGA